MISKRYYIYILECSNGAYYTGYTTDIVRRYQEHVDGSPKCKYTRSFPPVALAACWECDADLSTVLMLESAIKKLKRENKAKLLNNLACLSDMIDTSCLESATIERVK